MIRFEPRDLRGPAQAVVPVTVAAGAVAIAALATAAFAALTGHAVAIGAFAAQPALTEMLTRAAPLILTGLAASLAFRIRLYNFGGEGQFLAGAFVALAVAASPVPPWIMLAALLAAGTIAGAAVMLIPTALKIKRNADEAIVSLLLNVVILLCIQMALSGSPERWAASVARVVERAGACTGVIVALTIAAAIAVLVRMTVWGLQIRAVSENPAAARFVGIPIARLTMQVGLASGALAGLGGAVAVASGHALSSAGPYSGLGYAGIVVAVIAGRSVAGAVAAAFLITAILVGARTSAAPGAMPVLPEDVFLAVALTLCLFGTGLARYRMIFMRTGKAAP
jgi:simple sugar transport system permease protein